MQSRIRVSKHHGIEEGSLKGEEEVFAFLPQVVGFTPLQVPLQASQCELQTLIHFYMFKCGTF